MCLAFSLKLQNEQLRMMAEVAGSRVLSRKLGEKCPVAAPLLTHVTIHCFWSVTRVQSFAAGTVNLPRAL